MQRLKERLVTRRNALNLSQVALAERSQVSPRAIAAYETGESTPTHSRLVKLADALGVEPGWLLGSEESEPHGAVEIGERLPFRPEAGLDLKKLPQKTLEDLFNALGRDYTSEKEDAGRTRISGLIDKVLAELKRRDEKPKLEGRGLTEDVREIALGTRDVAEQMRRQRGGPESQRLGKAVSPSDSKDRPDGGARKGKADGSGDQ